MRACSEPDSVPNTLNPQHGLRRKILSFYSLSRTGQPLCRGAKRCAQITSGGSLRSLDSWPGAPVFLLRSGVSEERCGCGGLS